MKSTINSVSTFCVGNYYEKTGSTITKYYYAGATRIGMRKYTIPQSMVVEYFLGDHPSTGSGHRLGSTSITTDNLGAKVSEMRYKPFGEVRYTWKDATLTQTTPTYALTKWTFTAQYSYADDPSTPGVEDFGLLYFNARWVDPALGRFAQADSIIPEQSQGVQAWDRYAFANNNPAKYTDPSGHFINFILGAAIGAVAGISMVAVNAAIHPDVQLSAKDYAIAAGVGAAAGLLISTGVGAGAGTALGATLLGAGVGAGATAAGYTLASGAEYSSSEMAANAAIGAIAGAASAGVGTLATGASGLTKAAVAFDQAAISMNAGLAQQIVGDAFNGNGTTTSDLGVAGTTGLLAFAAGSAIETWLPGGGRIAGPLLRGTLVEAGNNWLTETTTAGNNTPLNWHDCIGRSACCPNP